ncbi:MAG TPA: hypothetical protein VGL60_00275 [Acidimicrobiales bacterium]
MSEEQGRTGLGLDALDDLADRLRAALDRDDRDEVDGLVRQVPEDQLHDVWLRVIRRPTEPRPTPHPSAGAESA